MFSGDGKPQIDRERLAAKAEELDRTVQRLGALRDGLRHAAACPAPSHLECPSFQKLLRAASLRHARPASSRVSAKKRKKGGRTD